MSRKDTRLIFSPHAGNRLKEKGIPREAARNVALYGHTVKTEKIGNYFYETKRGEYKGQALHVILQAGHIVRTSYWANEWSVRVNMKRHRGVKQA